MLHCLHKKRHKNAAHVPLLLKMTPFSSQSPPQTALNPIFSPVFTQEHGFLAAPPSAVGKAALLLIPKECSKSHSSGSSLKRNNQRSLSSHNGKNEDLNLTQRVAEQTHSAVPGTLPAPLTEGLEQRSHNHTKQEHLSSFGQITS